MNDLLRWADADQISAMVVAFIPRMVAALIVFFLFWAALRLTQRPIRAGLQRAGFADALIRLIVDSLYKGAVLLLGLVMAASQLGINVGAALAGIGVVGVAVGFAAQETLANMIAGFLIFWDRPFKIGDYITAHGLYGEVTAITMRTTRIRTMENTYVVIPNSQIIGEVLVNHSMYGETRVNVPIGIAYKEQIAQARDVLLSTVGGLDGVMAKPEPTVVVSELDNSSVNLLVRVWIDDACDERPVFHRVMEASKVALDRAGIEIPFPHLQLFVDDVRDKVWADAARFPGLGSDT
ncbi:MAG: mechanosensitive ion channel family protein [Gemmatimonadales bacterium]|nr:MAG: mechanosensitive ion channel family protein [Gemmatimonadales bacterium]